MTKTDVWMNASFRCKKMGFKYPYLDSELAEIFDVDAKKVCVVAGLVNAKMVKFAEQGGRPPMLWHTDNHKGVWYKLVGDEAGGEKEKTELRKTLCRYTTQLERQFMLSQLQEITPKMKKHLKQVLVVAEVSVRLATEAYNTLPESEYNKVLNEFLAPYKKRLSEILEQNESTD